MVAGLKGWFGGGKGGSAAAGSEVAGGAAAAEVPADEGEGEFDPDADDSEEEA
jgi:hypothetical protein